MRTPGEGKRLFVVVAYDIRDDRRRARVCRELSAYGTRVEYSVFECWISPSALSKLHGILTELIDPREDKVRYYLLCKSCRRRTLQLGGELIPNPGAIVV